MPSRGRKPFFCGSNLGELKISGIARGRAKMTTMKYIGDLVIDSTGPLRKIRLPDGLYVVGQEMLIAVDSEKEADDIIEEFKEDYGLH
jgi:hypothetical protein